MSRNHAYLVNECLEWLAKNRFKAWQNNTGAVRVDNHLFRAGQSGSSDIICPVANGVVAFIEVKTENDPQRKSQKIFMRNMVEPSGCPYFIARAPNHLGMLGNLIRLRDKLLQNGTLSYSHEGQPTF